MHLLYDYVHAIISFKIIYFKHPNHVIISHAFLSTPLTSSSPSSMEIPPSPAGDPPAEAPITGRIAGGTELSWCRAVPGGTGITVLALLLSRSPSLSRLRSSLLQLQLSHPILRSLLPSAAAASGHPPAILISPSPSDRIDIIPSNSPADFHLILERELNRNPWAEPDGKNPARSFFASVYELREPARHVLALRFHTGACDRIAGVTILRELMHLMLEGEEDEEVGREGEVCPAIEDLIRKEDAYKPFWARGKDLIGYSLNGLRSSGLGFEDAGSGRRSEFVRLVMDGEATTRLLNVR